MDVLEGERQVRCHSKLKKHVKAIEKYKKKKDTDKRIHTGWHIGTTLQ